MWCVVAAALCSAQLLTLPSPIAAPLSPRQQSKFTAGSETRMPQCIQAWAFDEDGALLGQASVTVRYVGVGDPEAPLNMSADVMDESSIRWIWSNTTADTAWFDIYAGRGPAPPTTLSAQTYAGEACYYYFDLQANTQYSCQINAVDSNCSNIQTGKLTVSTLAGTPTYAGSGSRSVYCGKGPGGANTTYLPGTPVAFTSPNGFGDGSARAAYYAYIWNNDQILPSGQTPTAYWADGDLVLTPTSEGAYYLHLWACNEDGLTSRKHLTLGPYVVGETCAHAKALQLGTQVTLRNKVVSGVFDNYIYIQEPGRTSGIRVDGVFAVLPGSIVTVIGTPELELSEACLANAALLNAERGEEPKPLLVSNMAMGGGACGNQPGFANIVGNKNKYAAGLSPIGVLVKTAGMVTYVDPPPERFAYIDDGSRLSDGSGCLGIKVSLENTPVPAAGTFAQVIGCCSATEIGGLCVRYLQPREAADVEFDQVASSLHNSGFEGANAQPWVQVIGTAVSTQLALPFGMLPHAGSRCIAAIFSGAPVSGTVAQIAPAVYGSYRASVWSCVRHTLGDSSSATNRVGIDPSGGLDPASPTVTWSAWDSQPTANCSVWREISTPAVECITSECTVFLQYLQRGSRSQVNCFDDARLVEQP